jgi:hypothetical protein
MLEYMMELVFQATGPTSRVQHIRSGHLNKYLNKEKNNGEWQRKIYYTT